MSTENTANATDRPDAINAAWSTSTTNTSADRASDSKPPPTADPFDPAALRLSQNFMTTGGVVKHLTTVPARRPTAAEWFRLNASAEYRLDALIFELKETRETYLIAPQLHGELMALPMVSARRLFLGVNRQGSPFVWSVRLPRSDGRTDRWAETALEAANAALNGWIRMQADMGLGGFVYFTTLAELTDPVWPDNSFAEILRLAFRSFFIDSFDHVVLRQLRGEI